MIKLIVNDENLSDSNQYFYNNLTLMDELVKQSAHQYQNRPERKLYLEYPLINGISSLFCQLWNKISHRVDKKNRVSLFKRNKPDFKNKHAHIQMFLSDMPTITLSRIKCLISGNFSSISDVIIEIK